MDRSRDIICNGFGIVSSISTLSGHINSGITILTDSNLTLSWTLTTFDIICYCNKSISGFLDLYIIGFVKIIYQYQV